MIMKANNPASEFCGCVWFVMCIVTCFKDHDRMPVRSNMVAKLKRTDLLLRPPASPPRWNKIRLPSDASGAVEEEPQTDGRLPLPPRRLVRPPLRLLLHPRRSGGARLARSLPHPRPRGARLRACSTRCVQGYLEVISEC